MPLRRRGMNEVCNDFVAALGESIEDPRLFEILEKQARKAGYTIKAEQQGIRGTFLHFEKIHQGDAS